MKIKVATNDENYKQVVLCRAKTICWVLLFVCFTIKIFGGDFFNIICNNERFVKFCEFVDGSIAMQFLIGTISSYVTYSLFYLAILRKSWFKTWETIFMVVSIPIFVALRIWATSNGILIVSTIINVVQFFIIPFVFERGDKVLCLRWFVPTYIYGNIANLAFQLISAVVKSERIRILNTNFLIAVIFAIDVYLMLTLYYLYSINKNGGKKMGWLIDWLFGKSKKQLENMKQTRLDKIAKLEAEVKAIDEKIKKAD